MSAPHLNGATVGVSVDWPAGCVAEVQIDLVPLDVLFEAWRDVVHYIEQALGRSVLYELTIDEVYKRIADGRYLLLAISRRGPAWHGVIGAAVLAVERNGRGEKYVAMIAVGGLAVETWLEPLLRMVESMGRMAGATRIAAVGRPGWVRIMRSLGVRHRASVFSYEISGAA